MAKPIVAVVGRPNVGKSTLFNKIIGKRLSIVDDTPGVTRDRIYGDAEWQGHKFMMVDTGGIEPKTDDIILSSMRSQAQLAIDTAAVIIFVTDLKTGVTAADMDVAAMLQKSGKPIVLCVNKCDKIGDTPMEFYEFYNLGLGDPIAVSSVHGHGTGDLLDAVMEHIDASEFETTDEDIINVAVIGKPNAGKSSLINRIVGEKRLIVSNIPGTTRDAVDTIVTNQYGTYTFIDTAGIRRQARIKDSVEHYSVLRSHTAVDRADVCLIMIDAAEGITEQDEKIAGIAHEAGRASIIVVNKWDSITDKDNSTVNEYNNKIRIALGYMPYAPIMYVSALTGQRVTNLFEHIDYVYGQSVMRITTGMLNDVLRDAMIRVQPPSDKGKRLKIYYMTQIGIQPPTFVIFCNNAELFHFSYQRYIENCLRNTFGFKGTPIKLIIREKGDDKN